MDKEFIPADETTELMLLGFEDPTIAYRTQGVITLLDKPRFMMASCILYQQAFRWFREKDYDVELTSHKNKKGENWYSFIIVPFKTRRAIYSTNPDVYKTYEEAELACLRKLIEIVKNK